MIRIYLAGAALVAFLWLGGAFAWQGQQLKAAQKRIVSLKAEKLALEASAKKEAEIQTVTRTVYRTVEKVKHEIAAVDPQCANEGALVAAWSAGIDRVREAGTDRAATIDTVSVPVSGQGEGENR